VVMPTTYIQEIKHSNLRYTTGYNHLKKLFLSFPILQNKIAEYLSNRPQGPPCKCFPTHHVVPVTAQSNNQNSKMTYAENLQMTDLELIYFLQK
jgi:hypothetical protein